MLTPPPGIASKSTVPLMSMPSPAVFPSMVRGPRPVIVSVPPMRMPSPPVERIVPLVYEMVAEPFAVTSRPLPADVIGVLSIVTVVSASRESITGLIRSLLGVPSPSPMFASGTKPLTAETTEMAWSLTLSGPMACGVM